MDAHILKELQEALEKECGQVLSELKSIAKPSLNIRGDWDVKYPTFEAGENASHIQKEEEADEVEEYEMRLATDQSLESRLLEINRALERIKAGTFGFCKKCKKEIGLERLRANPAAEYHVEHI